MLTNRFTLAKNAAVVLFLVVSVLLFTVPSAQADEAQAKSSGILPLPDYSGDYAKRAARAISYFPRDPGNLTFKDSEA
jgi:hypothetical protein